MNNLTTEEVFASLRAARKNAVKVVFTGGEPTVRKDIFRILEYAKSLGYRDIVVISNGRMCSYPKFTEKLVASGLTGITVSLPDIRKEFYDRITSVKGGFEQLEKAISNVIEHRIDICTISVITKENYAFLPEITEYLSNMLKRMPAKTKPNKRQRIFFSEFVFINPSDNAWINRHALVPRMRDAAPFIHKALDIAKASGLTLSVEAVPFCYMKDYEERVVELNMAKERVMIDPERQFDYEYNEHRKNLGKTKGHACRGCVYDDMCEGVWKNYALIFGTDELVPVKQDYRTGEKPPVQQKGSPKPANKD